MSDCACAGCSVPPSGSRCGCCDGVSVSTPKPLNNRPLLGALRYRVGVHAQFFESMKARLATVSVEGADGAPLRPLQRLTTRDGDDASIALLDAWAIVGDVLTFYQERIANEGYLRTALERRSVLELARLVGYAPRPGVAASTFLAFTIDPGSNGPVAVPRGARAQSIPGPGEQAQFFETEDDLVARAEWNVLKPRLTAPPLFTRVSAVRAKQLYLAGTATALKPGDRLLFVFGGEAREQIVREVRAIEPDEEAKRTKVLLRPLPEMFGAVSPVLFALTDVRLDLGDEGSELRKLSEALMRSIDYFALSLEQGLLGEHTILQALTGLIFVGSLQPVAKELVSHARFYAAIKTLNAAAPEQPEARAAGAKRISPRLEPLRYEVHTLEGFDVAMATRLRQPLRATVGASVSDPAPAPAPPAPPPAGPAPSPAEELTSQLFSRLAPALLALNDDAEFMDEFVDFVVQVARELTPRTPQEGRELRALLQRELTSAKASADSENSATIFALWRVLARLFGDSTVGGAGKNLPDALFSAIGTLLRHPRISEAAVALANSVALPTDGPDLKRRIDRLFRVDTAASAKSLGSVVGALKAPAQPQLRHASELERDPRAAFVKDSDSSIQLLLGFQPPLRDTLYRAWGKTEIGNAEPALKELYALRLVAPPFGSAAGSKLTVKEQNEGAAIVEQGDWPLADDEDEDNVFLDSEYRAVPRRGYALIHSTPDPRMASQVFGEGRAGEDRLTAVLQNAYLFTRFRLLRTSNAEVLQRSEYGLNGKSTRLDFDDKWRGVAFDQRRASDWSLRHTLVYAQSEELKLAEEPLSREICEPTQLELDRLVDGLESGRFFIVSGERTDLPGPGVVTSELCMLAAATQSGNVKLPGEKPHTTLSFVKPLAHCYKRDTLSIWGNVARATHGESRGEVLGAGDGTRKNQRFGLKQPPLTYVSAPIAAGAASTLRVFVNDVEWHAAPHLVEQEPTARVFATRIDDDGKTSVVFGDGLEGARLPTGSDNVRAEYRSGIGRGGNVKAGQIATLVTRPLGLREVTNPLAATGGADRESRDQARQNAPLAVRALDRLVAVRDYADFARTFAGVAKASAAELSSGAQSLVHVTIAGVDDAPIDETSDLLRNLKQVLAELGDPYQPVRVDVRERLMLVLSARIRPMPDYPWQPLYERIRAALLQAFGFDRRELGQSVTSSEVLSVIQGVRGVSYVDLDVLTSLSEADVLALLAGAAPSSTGLSRDRVEAKLAQRDAARESGVAPAQLVYLSAEVSDTLVLNLNKDPE